MGRWTFIGGIILFILAGLVILMNRNYISSSQIDPGWLMFALLFLALAFIIFNFKYLKAKPATV